MILTSRLLLLLLASFLAGGPAAIAADVRIQKVLPHFLDQKGRISVAPGLFDRDGYQQKLRQSPALVSGMRFDMQWKCPRSRRDAMTLRIELRTARAEPGHPVVIQAPAHGNRRLGGWSSVVLEGDEYTKAGEVLAWRAVILEDGQEVAEQKSFLW